MKLSNLFLVFFILCSTAGYAIDVSGEQSGTWENGYTYQVVGDVSVISGTTLTIEPGTVIEFMGYYELNVTGVLLAEGTEADSIIFTSGLPDPNKGVWARINLEQSQASASIISFCLVEYAAVGISCTDNAGMIIRNNVIRECNFGISTYYASPLIESNSISDIYYAAIHASQLSPQVIIRGNFITNAGGTGIECWDFSNCLVENNVIEVNNSIGIYCYQSDSVIKGNFIQYGNEGIHCFDSDAIISENLLKDCATGVFSSSYSNPEILNNTIVGCGTAVILEEIIDNTYTYIQNNIFYDNNVALYPYLANYLSLSNNLFWENEYNSQGAGLTGLGVLTTINYNEDSCDIYNNIFLDPLFLDPENNDFHITAQSPAINAGFDNYHDPDGTVADIGAYYYQLAPAISKAAFQADVLFGAAPLQVNFVNQSSGDINGFFWDFGNGMTSNEENPTLEYLQNGLYSVSLTVSGDGGDDIYFCEDYIEVKPQMEMSGNVTGVWNSNSIYRITGDIFINEGETLVIEPGTDIRFMGYYSFNISGTLHAVGTEADSIIFTSGRNLPYRCDWGNINFNEQNSSESIIDYAIIEFGDYGIQCADSSPAISHSRISDNTFGIYTEIGSPLITENRISNISWYGIYLSYACVSQINGNIFANNSGSINVSGPGCYPQITDNVFFNDTGNAIYCHTSQSSLINISGNMFLNCNSGISLHYSGVAVHHNYFNGGESCAIGLDHCEGALIYNNTICNKETGIGCNQGDDIQIFNNIFYGIETAFTTNTLIQSLEYNLFYLNVDDLNGTCPAWFGVLDNINANNDLCDSGFNLFSSPRFLEAENHNFNLRENSPCVDAGNPDPAYNDPDNTISDMGAFCYQIVLDKENYDIPSPDITLTNYPNPFNPATTIEFNLPVSANCTLKIYNLKGELVKILLAENLDEGLHTLIWDGRDENNRSASSGVYFYRISAREKQITNRMILLK